MSLPSTRNARVLVAVVALAFASCKSDESDRSSSTSKVPKCSASNLTIFMGGGGAAGGNFGVRLLFVNTGRGPCKLSGYPEVAGVSGDGVTFTPARHTRAGYIGGVTSKPIPVVTLVPNGIASALVEAVNVPPGDRTTCGQFNEVRVSVPGESAPNTRFLAAAIPDCSGLEVHPVVEGPSGNFGAAP